MRKPLTPFRYLFCVMTILSLAATLSACTSSKDSAAFKGQVADNDPVKGEEKAVLTDPPAVPPAITRKHATKVLVDLEIVEEVREIAPGVKYNFWTFGGKVPGKFIRVRVGDQVEFTLRNHPNNKNPHNIDLHSVNGPGGGASASLIAPGHSATFSFKVLNPGLYIYHCATAPVAMHIANGMYGLILVEPKEGLPKVDREYYVVQGDFYTKGPNGQIGLQPFSMTKTIDERPEYVLFNGEVGALAGDKALQSKVGETIRLFVGNGGPNLSSAFHVIGEIFDKVHVEGGSTVNENVQTTMIPPGGSAIVEFKVNTSGTYILVDHALSRAFNKGAVGQLKVDGDPNTVVYSGRIAEDVYMPEGSRIRSIETKEAHAPMTTRAERVTAGKALYAKNCAACHQPDGSGVANAFPPLAKSDYLNADVDRAIQVVAHGLQGPIKVNGQVYNAVMPALQLNDDEIASILSYVYTMAGNSNKDVTSQMVKVARAKGPVSGQTAEH